MNGSTRLHEEAMELADEGDQLRRKGELGAATNAFFQALGREREAAQQEESEPSRGILFRSAAWLALEADQPREAERLAAEGLRSSLVSDRVADELRGVMEAAWARLHRNVAA
jgi:hypothetical protein